MQDMALLSMWILFIAVGMLSPFVWSLGYVWVDVLLPHRLSYSLLSSVPIAFIMGAGAVLAYLLLDRKNPPKIALVHWLCMLMAVWITLTTTWAVVPTQAWIKWDVSFKTVIFTCFMPFVFRSRVQIEAFLLVFTLSAAAHLIPWGVKTFINGGGYQLSLGLMGSNSTTLAESSSVAAVTAMFVPLLIWMRTHSLLIPWQKVRTGMSLGLTVLYLVANVGTFARTGLIGIAILGGGLLMRTRRKILYIFLALVMGGVMYYVTSDKWTSRIETIQDYQTEGSALVRLLVWKWTLDFAVSHPLGGGFNSYLVNVIPLPPAPDGSQVIQHGRAFHNIFFAALGEHGYPGLALYVTIMGLCVLNMTRIIRSTKKRPDLLWASDLARALQLALLIMLACGNFVDISFIFLIWDLVALTICLNAHVYAVLHQSAAGAEQPAKGIRLRNAPGVPIPQMR